MLDTHALVWYVTRPSRIGKGATKALRAVEAGRALAWLPAILPIEIALLHERGRTGLGLPELAATLERCPGMKLWPLDLTQAREFVALRSIRDPFDRLIVSAARAARCPLVSCDEALSRSGLVEILWD
jgi:PIN domain nuclease of toxin-antitoxin system